MFYSVNSRYIKAISHKTVFWNLPANGKELFLTFDDGPVPGTTEFILKELGRHNAKATFFCVGDNIRKYPSLFEEMKSEGHSIGNHTYHHLNGWKHSARTYVNNVKMCQTLTGTKLFRPPYGRMTPMQRYVLQKEYYILLWSVLPGDFDPDIDKEVCFNRMIKHSHTPGSIIVLHDNLKAEKKLRYTLPKYLEASLDLGYNFTAISENMCRIQLEARRSRLLHQLSLGII